MNAAQRLGQLQYQGHLSIDNAYQPLVSQVSDLILRHATIGIGGVLRLRADVVPLLRNGIVRLIDAIRPVLVNVVMTTSRDAELLADPVGRVDDEAITMSGVTADHSLRLSQEMVGSQIGMLLTRGTSMGLPAREIARTVAQYVSPWFSQRRNAMGDVLRGDRLGVIKSWPGRAGMASAPARSLMLTETRRAHSRGILRRARRDDLWVAYRLGPGHIGSDECDDLAQRGPYRVEDAPSPPRHPRCRCMLQPVDPPRGRRAA